MTTRKPIPPPFELSGPGRLVRRQTTFWDVEIGSVMRRVRIHFRGKEEFAGQEDWFEDLRVVAEHPLLEDYSSEHVDLYIGTAFDEPSAIISLIQTRVRDRTEGWRSPARYFNDLAGPEAVLRAGYGLLLGGPLGLVEELDHIVASFGVQTNKLRSRRPKKELQALLLAPNYVVAEEFLLEGLTDEAVR